MDILDMLYNKIVTPAKEKLKDELFEGMDRCARVLVVTQRIGEVLNLFDSVTYVDILNQYANKHFEATKNMDHDQLLAYMAEGGNKHASEDI